MAANQSFLGTTVFYNGVALRNCLTKQFDQVVEYDPSGTDRIYNRFVISVEALVTDQDMYLGFQAEPPVTCIGVGNYPPLESTQFTSQGKLNIIQALLSVPRQEFVYYQGDQIVVRANSDVSTLSGQGEFFNQWTDLNNGPKPKSVNVTQVVANRVYRVTFSIEVCLLWCATQYNLHGMPDFVGSLGGDSITPEKNDGVTNRRLISNRYSIDDSRDENFFSTRALIGRARVAHEKLWSYAIRTLVMPSLQPGYQRVQTKFTVAPNGLDLSYQVVDRQRYAAPPYPATDFEGQHLETTGIDGSVSHGVIQVGLKGSPDTPKRGLLMAGIAIVQSRIGKFGKIGQSDEKVIAEQVTITDVLQENAITLQIQYTRKGGGTKEDGTEEKWLEIMTKRLGLLPSVDILLRDPELQAQSTAGVEDPDWYRLDGRASNQDRWMLPAQQWDDGAPYGIFSSYLQDGCIPVHATPDTVWPDSPQPEPPYRPEPPPEQYRRVSPNEEIGRDMENFPGSAGELPSEVSVEQTQIPYTHYEIRSDYDDDRGYVALPFFSSDTTPKDDDVLITKLRATVCTKTVFVSAKRQGAPPVIPALHDEQVDINGIKYVLANVHQELAAPVLMPDQANYEYEMNMRLTYYMSRGRKYDDKITYGTLPWDTSTKLDHLADISTANQNEELNPLIPKEEKKDSNQR